MVNGGTYMHVGNSTDTWFMYVGAYARIYLLTVAKLMKAVPETWNEDVNISVVCITVVLYKTF
jgi:hypothetical protein